jgi:endonuclease/exonuclease/phosphatase family metal-dependent hydrolase
MPVLAALLLGVLAVSPALAAPPPRPLTFVSYNVYHGGPLSVVIGDGAQLDRRLDVAAAELEALGADIIGLQEASVGRDRGHVAQRFAGRLGFEWVHARATTYVFPWRWLGKAIVWLMGFEEGPAILSRFPIVDHQTYPLPVCRKRFDARALVRAEIRTPWGPLQVFSTHTSHDECQVREVAEIVGRYRGPLPAIVMADFNAAEGAAWITALRAEHGFVDAFREVNPTARGHTVWQRIDAPAPTVRRRVDYVFLVPGTAVRGRVLDSRLVLDAPVRLEDGGYLWPSDHYGVLASVDIFSPATAGLAPGGRS